MLNRAKQYIYSFYAFHFPLFNKHFRNVASIETRALKKAGLFAF